jgi:hypothetical protein
MKSLKKARPFLYAIGVFVLASLLLGAAGIGAWEYTNSDAFCANMCHGVHPEEPYAHRLSRHARVACVECHIGRLSTLEAMVSKAAHTAHVWAMLTGYERPLTSYSMPASRRSCEGCHSAVPHQNDAVRVRKHYANDEANTETTVELLLHTATARASPRAGEAKGIHWHTENQVRFIAAGPLKQEIPWVEATYLDGTTVVYTDKTRPVMQEEAAATDKSLMVCVDCHNRVGHPFRNPEGVLDDALAEGRLNRRFPFVKARVVALLEQEFSSEEEAMRIVEDAYAQYIRDFPNLPKDYPEDVAELKEFVKERQEFVANLLVRSKFLEPGVSWHSFPDNSGHLQSPGCFRCHSGKHVSEGGAAIPTNCTTCHDVPIFVREGALPPTIPSPFGRYRPASHREPDFRTEHRNLVDESCAACHGSVQFGSDNSSFCSNPACHGRSWPNLESTASWDK